MNFNRTTLYSTLIVGGVGTFFIWQMGRLPLVLGWWCGVAVGIVNFSFLLSSMRKAHEPQETAQKIKVPRQPFFLRYLALALVFFLILQLGQEQFGAALLGFASYYIAMLVDYLIRLRKQKSA
ncbi:MAG TPA: hypothetical protein VJA00_01005 [Candidatus Omnitrophota bacterium]|nr:hypothetical protein [Candidatus Omnitrophota bacterium]